VQKIEDGWEETRAKATTRLQFLQKTKAAWIGYAEGLETIAMEFEKADEEMKKVGLGRNARYFTVPMSVSNLIGK
jgi:hypothetical protein